MRTHVGPYRIEGSLGRGGMGVVYRGVHPRLDRIVAIKALAPELTQQPEFKERFFAEARTQAQLLHPNIATVYDLLEDQGEFFIVMEHVAGLALDEILRQAPGHRLDQGRALALFSQVLAALDYAHSEAVIHRDIKPANILVTESGRVKLMDFGIALLVGDKRLTSSQATIGTPVYMSPEQILRPRQTDHRADIYSAAIVLFEMLAGRPPFDAETGYEINKLQIEAPPPDLARLAPGTAPAVVAAIERGLAKDPDARFVSAGVFLRALGDTLPEVPGRPPGPETPPAPATGPGGMRGPATPRWSTPAAATPAGPPLAAAPAGFPSPVPAGSAPAQSTPLPAPRRGPRPVLIAGAGLAAAAVAAAILLGRHSGAGSPASPAAPPVPVAAAPVPAAAPAPLIGGAAQPPPAPAVAASAGAPGQRAEVMPAGGGEPPRRQGDAPRQGIGPPRSDRSATRGAAGASPGAGVAAETHRRELAKTRDVLRSGIARAEEEIAANQLPAARERVAGLLTLAATDQADLVEEVASLRVIEKRATAAMVAARAAAKEAEVEQTGWQRRLQEIGDLNAKQSYPEAKQLADRLASDPAVPPEVAAQARELGKQAEQGLKSIFSKSKVGNSTNEIQRRPPSP